MSCGEFKNTCGGGKINAKCVDYDRNLGEKSKLKQGCTDVSATTEELYTLVDWLYSNTSEVEVTDNCLLSNGKYSVKRIVKEYGKEICNLKKITENADYDTIIKDLDMKCLTTPCGKKISNIKELFQALINKNCV